MKNKVIKFLLLFLLFCPICVIAIEENANQTVAQNETLVTEPTENVVNNAVLDEDKTTENVTPTASVPYKQPISKRKIAKKFLKAMLGVGISSFLIFFVLTLYNRIRRDIADKVKTPDGETSLQSPDDMDSAIKTFLDKTKW